MKKTTIFRLVTLLTLAGCSLVSRDKNLKQSIPGTYVYQGEQEYSRIKDTIVISTAEGNENLFRITRRTRFNRIREGKLLPSEFKVQSMTGIFDEDAKVIQESKTGRIISFDPERNRLYVQTQAYEKIQ